MRVHVTVCPPGDRALAAAAGARLLVQGRQRPADQSISMIASQLAGNRW
jgi:hypothetical protein